MIGLFFEVIPLEGHASRYFELAAALRPELERSGGVLSLIATPVSTGPASSCRTNGGRNEDSLIRWRGHTQHRAIQRAGREQHFRDYRLRIGPAVDASRAASAARSLWVSYHDTKPATRLAASCSRAFTGKGNISSYPSTRPPRRTRRRSARPSRSRATTRCTSAPKLRRTIRRSRAIPSVFNSHKGIRRSGPAQQEPESGRGFPGSR